MNPGGLVLTDGNGTSHLLAGMETTGQNLEHMDQKCISAAALLDPTQL